MMICIDLDNEEEDVVMADKVENTNIMEKKFIFKRKLVLAVRKHRALYDNKHKFFRNVAKKELIWQQIAKHLKTDVDICKQTWIELRYSYQCHARRLHKYFLTGHKQNHKRPAMALELELMFLWRFIENRKTSNLPFDISDVIEEAEKELVQESNKTEIQIEMETESAELGNKPDIEDVHKDNNSTAIYKEIDEDLILIEQPVELIVIDEDDDNGKSEKQFKISDSMKKLVQQIKTYPELYDSDNVVYNDYSHRSNIWNSIAIFLGDKATKLMKCWIIMQTRYEWEIMHINNENGGDSTPSELQKELEFLKSHILKNPDTVYKQSYYLKTQWFDPIDYFKDIYNLIVRMKKTIEVVYITDSLLKSKEKNKQYLTLWSEIANPKGCSAGQCEVTWLIMRYFYWELMSMRQQKYKLTDKWYFETIITELYAIAKVTQTAKQHEQQVLKTKKPNKKSSKNSSLPASKSKTLNTTTTTATITATAVLPQNTTTITTATTTTINNLQSLPVSNSNSITTSTATLPLPLPKITAAISLAPQMLNAGSLQIKQISGPPCVAIKQSVNGAISTSRVSSMPSTLVQQQVQTPAPMQMQYSLSNQLKVTSVPLSNTSIPAIRPLVATTSQSVVGSTASTLISIRTKAPAPVPTQIVQKVNFMPTLTPGTIQSTVRPIMTSSVQSFTSTTIQQPTVQPVMTVATSRASVIPTSQPTNSFAVPIVSTVPPLPPLSMITNSTTPAVNCKIATVSTPISTSTSSSSTSSSANNSQFPKISGAASLLNPNEILIELIASQNGNHLVVHGPPLTTKYQLPMPTVARFIREVLGVPLLHNKRVYQPAVVNNYWELIAKKFNLPVHICRACWNFLLENFNHFPQIAPLKEVMRPFPTTINVWVESTVLFKKFDEHCLAMGWKPYMSCIPEVVECIGGYPVLYQDISKDNNNIQSDMEALCAWRTINLRFPKIPPLKEIWKSIKVCFCQYMADLELSIENRWSLNWWRAFARLKFLVEAKYSTNEPFYYIVSNKMVEEIERCAMLEMKERYKKDLTGEEIPVKSDNDDRKPEQEEEKPALPPAQSENLIVKQDIELNTLLTAMQKHSAIFKKANSEEKYEAWKKVAKELHMEVIDCLMSFKRATQMYYAFKKQDPVNNCRLNEKYYKKLDKIIRTISLNKASSSRCSTLNVKTPFELNQSLDSASTCSDYVFPERFIPDISMTNSPSNLVVKNWIYAFGNRNLNDTVKGKLQKVLKKYIKSVDDHHSYS